MYKIITATYLYKEKILSLINEVFEKDEKELYIDDNNKIIIAIDDNDEVLGLVNIHFIKDIFNKYYMTYDYVCVNKNHRNKGIAKRLINECENIGRKYNVKYITFTSNEKRIEAHSLYKSLGYSIKDTNVFRKDFLVN